MQTINVGKLAVLATHLNGAADSGRYEHITPEVVKRELASGDVFGLLARELGAEVDLSTLTDVDRLVLAREWRTSAAVYETQQFRVNRGGLALLVAYLASRHPHPRLRSSQMIAPWPAERPMPMNVIGAKTR